MPAEPYHDIEGLQADISPDGLPTIKRVMIRGNRKQQASVEK